MPNAVKALMSGVRALTLDEVTGTGSVTGVAFAVPVKSGSGRNTISVDVVYDGAVSALDYTIEGSNDGGVTWGTLATFDETDPPIQVLDAAALQYRAVQQGHTGGTSVSIGLTLI